MIVWEEFTWEIYRAILKRDCSATDFLTEVKNECIESALCGQTDSYANELCDVLEEYILR